VLFRSRLPIRPGLLLLTYCYNARPEYLKRAVDPHITHELLQDFDGRVDECLLKMVGEDPLTRERIGRLRGIKGEYRELVHTWDGMPMDRKLQLTTQRRSGCLGTVFEVLL